MNITEVDVPLRVVRVYAHCEKCGARLGEAVPLPRLGGFACDSQGNWAPVNSPRYLYTCPVCGEKSETDECYPRIECREVEE